MRLAERKRSTSRPRALQAAECLFAMWDQTRDLAFGLGTLILHIDPQGSASQLLQDSLWVWILLVSAKGEPADVLSLWVSWPSRPHLRTLSSLCSSTPSLLSEVQ